MRSILRRLMLFLLCVSVLITVGIDLNTRMNLQPYTILDAPHLSVSHKSTTDLTLRRPVTRFMYEDYMKYNNQQVNLVEEEVKKSEGNQFDRDYKVDRSIANVIKNYEVTAHYLNVRTDKHPASEIIHVVEHGDILEVEDKTDNNWLKLKDEGYVHSKYAKLIIESDKQTTELISTNQPIRSIQSIRTIQFIDNLQPIEPNKPTSAVKSESKLTEDHISQMLEGTLLADQGLEQTILETEREYGINAFFTIAVMKLESGHGKSKIAKEKNNLFGLNAIDGDAFNKAFSFETKGESVEKFGQLIAEKYVDKGLTSIEEVASKYCQANSKWSSLVMSIMKSDYRKLV